MTWLSLRTQRTEVLIAAALLALLVAALVPTGLDMLSAYHHDGLATCVAHPATGGCGDAIHSFTDRFGALANTLGWLTLVPGLIGVLLAAPTILELENGTHHLAWTQSITRRRWIAVKLLVAVLSASVAAGILILLLTWWRSPLDHLNGRMDVAPFDSQGTVALGYTLFALGLALAIGVVWRRAVPAILVAFGAYVAARVFVDTSLRQHYKAPLSATWPFTQPGPDLSHDWVLSQHPSNSLGQGIPVHLSPQGVCFKGVANCIGNHGSGFTHAVYEPASRFWLFQGIETALFAGVALALIAFAGWWIHERVS